MLSGGRLKRSLDSGDSQEVFPEEMRLQLRLVRRKEVGLAGTESGPPGVTESWKRPKQRFIFASFVVTPTSLKGHLEKRENGFRAIIFASHLETGLSGRSLM